MGLLFVKRSTDIFVFLYLQKEDELDDLRTGEKDKRANRSVPNVFIVLTQSESKTHEQELIKVGLC